MSPLVEIFYSYYKLGMPMKHTNKLAGFLNCENLSFFLDILVALSN